MNNHTRYALTLGLSIFLCCNVLYGRDVSVEQKDDLEPLPLEELRVFTEVFGKIKSDFVDDVNDRDLLQHAVRGMLSGLDPHSSYLDPESFDELRIGTEGRFGGLGVEVTMDNGLIKVVTPIDDTPAYRAGLQSGDIIIRLNDIPVKGMDLSKAVGIMRGDPGTDIKLSITREGENNPLQIVIQRAIIRIKSVKSRILAPGYGYIRIAQFLANTAEALRDAILDLQKKAGGALAGLVLDLRNNPGGTLTSAVAVSDTFLTEGIIVYTKGRQDDSKLQFNATPHDYLDKAPMVLLVNSGSASAAEIVAGALQDHKRAIVMGTKSFGKGSVQTILPMNNGAALKITTARYYTPKDRSIQATGIDPDIVVEDLKVASKKNHNNASRIREADLDGHLENQESGAKRAKNASLEISSVGEDFQLREALNLLKGMNIVLETHDE